VRQGSTIIRPTVALVLATTSTMLEVLSHALHMALCTFQGLSLEPPKAAVLNSCFKCCVSVAPVHVDWTQMKLKFAAELILFLTDLGLLVLELRRGHHTAPHA